MKKILSFFEHISAIILILLSLLIIVQVILRNSLGWGFVWSEEMARYLLLSMVLILSPVIFSRDEHVKLDYFVKTFVPSKYNKFTKLFSVLCITFFYVFYIFSHYNFIRYMGDVCTPSLNMQNQWFFLAGLIGAFTGVVVGICKLITILRFWGKE
ncbi:MAG: TRAP transporter small permease [Spirochaetia bacterium]|nr:TRAP transporter small permease [Spirochaetia bacterium]